MKTIKHGKAFFLDYTIVELQGTVLSESNRSETYVSGSGTTNPNISSASHSTISSTTTRYQTIYLKEDNGTEHAIRLVDCIVDCREGHKLTLLGIKDTHLWFKITNHTLNLVWTPKKELKEHTFPKNIYGVGTLLLGTGIMITLAKNTNDPVFAFFVIFGTLYAVLYLPAKLVGFLRYREIIAPPKLTSKENEKKVNEEEDFSDSKKTILWVVSSALICIVLSGFSVGWYQLTGRILKGAAFYWAFIFAIFFAAKKIASFIQPGKK